MAEEPLEKATFAGGCFWCMEAPFDAIEGVQSTIVGYCNGHTSNPNYQDVSSGQTGHAEAIEILFNPMVVSYAELLQVFWQNIDPTTENGQFADRGSQYRTGIYYHNDQQKILAEQSKQELNDSKKFKNPIVTEIVAATQFFPAEEHHQDYYLKNPIHYQSYSYGSGRKPFLTQTWGKESEL